MTKTTETQAERNEAMFSPRDFGGFGYRTTYDDGASSTVVFFNGAHANPINVRNSVTVGSDILDPQTDLQDALQKKSEGITSFASIVVA